MQGFGMWHPSWTKTKKTKKTKKTEKTQKMEKTKKTKKTKKGWGEELNPTHLDVVADRERTDDCEGNQHVDVQDTSADGAEGFLQDRRPADGDCDDGDPLQVVGCKDHSPENPTSEQAAQKHSLQRRTCSHPVASFLALLCPPPLLTHTPTTTATTATSTTCSEQPETLPSKIAVVRQAMSVCENQPCTHPTAR